MYLSKNNNSAEYMNNILYKKFDEIISYRILIR